MTPEQALQKAVKARNLTESDKALAVLAEMVIEGRIPSWPTRKVIILDWESLADKGMREAIWRGFHYHCYQNHMKRLECPITPREAVINPLCGLSESGRQQFLIWLEEGGKFPHIETTTVAADTLISTLQTHTKFEIYRQTGYSMWPEHCYKRIEYIHSFLHHYWLKNLEPVARAIAEQVEWNIKPVE